MADTQKNKEVILEFLKIMKYANGQLESPILYTKDKNGRVRIWQIIVASVAKIDANNVFDLHIGEWHTISGLEDGKKIVSDKKKLTKGKNIGQKNETTGLTQAILDARSEYNHRIKIGYVFKENLDKPVETPYPMAIHNVDKHNNWKKLHFPLWEQPKFDGTLYMVKLKTMEGFTRKLDQYAGQEHILDELRVLHKNFADWFLVGELWKKGFNLQDISGASRQLIKVREETKLEYWIFDCFNMKQDLGFEERQAELAKMFKVLKDAKYVKLTPTTKVESREEADKLYKKRIDEGLEGSVYRNVGAKYEWGSHGEIRVYDTMKRKPRLDAEYPVVDFKEGLRGKEVGQVIFVLAENADGVKKRTGKVLPLEERLRFNATPNWPQSVRKPVYANLKASPALWESIKGKEVIVEYSILSKNYLPQQPKVRNFREEGVLEKLIK